jgi:hypothetical protein
MPEYAPPPPALPDGWQAMLDNIDARLHEAIAAVDARAALLPAVAETASASRHQELTALSERIASLAERAAQTQTQAAEVDAVLTAGEEFLRWRLAETESLRQRVAAWRQSIG